MIPNPPTSEPIVNGEMLNLTLPWLTYYSLLTKALSGMPAGNELLPNFANDSAAAAGGVVLYGYYRNGSVVMQRVI